MLDDLKQKILVKFSKNQEHQACHLYDLIQTHINAIIERTKKL